MCSLGTSSLSYNTPRNEQVILQLAFPQEDYHSKLFPRHCTNKLPASTHSPLWVGQLPTLLTPPADLTTAPGCTCSCGASCSCPSGKCTCVRTSLSVEEQLLIQFPEMSHEQISAFPFIRRCFNTAKSIFFLLETA
jgi:hypothetical protein